jgi:hypothetical protein
VTARFVRWYGGVTRFASGPAVTPWTGNLVILTGAGTSDGDNGPSGWVPWDRGVTSFAFGPGPPSGDLIDLHGNGTLDGNGGSGVVAWDTGGTSFLVGSRGYCDVLASSGNHWQDSGPSARSLLDQAVESIWRSTGGFTQNARQANGTVWQFTTRTARGRWPDGCHEAASKRRAAGLDRSLEGGSSLVFSDGSYDFTGICYNRAIGPETFPW